MRIISGEYKGRRLLGPRGVELRPTSDRLKETLFNIIGPGIAGSILLDVFAGTGAIGLEALSRHAREAVFIESDREAVRLVRRNVEHCGITSGYRILQGDVFTSFRELAREGFTADIAFLDPPYNWGPYEDLISTLSRTRIVRAGSLVVVEHHRKAALPESGPGFRRTRVVKQSDKCLSFYQMTVDPRGSGVGG